MPQTRECDYCGGEIEPGTGTMLVQTDGTTLYYCSSKCEKNADLGRQPRDLNWTAAGRESDRQETVTAEQEATESEADTEESETTPDLEAETAEASDDAQSDTASEESDEEDTEAEEAEA